MSRALSTHRASTVCALALAAALWLGGCTDTVELVPDSRADAAADTIGRDGGVHDGSSDSVAGDSAGEAAAADTSVDSPSGCVCRFVQCRSNAECQSAIGASSTCDNPGTLSCSGGAGSCQRDVDCAGGAAGWRCTAGLTSLGACP